MKRCVSSPSGMMMAFLIPAVLVAGLVVLAVRWAPGQIRELRGYRALTVISGSMEPAIRTGDVIIVRPVHSVAEITAGEVITFRDSEDQEMLITHRVNRTMKADGVPTSFTTKGDANYSVDAAAVSFDQIVGRYQFRLPYFGYLASFILTPPGILILVLIAGVLLISMESRKIWEALSQAGPPERRDLAGKGQ